MHFPRKRAVLTDHDAAEIFKLRLSPENETSQQECCAVKSRSVLISQMYGVSPKAVRDIWNMRTWRHVTREMWSNEDSLQYLEFQRSINDGTAGKAQKGLSAPVQASVRKVGRPIGSKDSKPRQPRRFPPYNETSKRGAFEMQFPSINEPIADFSYSCMPFEHQPLDPGTSVFLSFDGRQAGRAHDTPLNGANAGDESMLCSEFPFFLQPQAVPFHGFAAEEAWGGSWAGWGGSLRT